MRIIFMGSPDFAIPSLEAISKKHELLAVVTASDKPAGRGHHLQETEVKKWALAHHVKLFQPVNLKSGHFLAEIDKLKPDIFVVVAFRMIPPILMDKSIWGAINLHGSLLPKYRGAAPIQRAIMAGESHTGLTVFKLDSKIDTGQIIQQKMMPIGENTTGGEIYDQMKGLGAELLIEVLEAIESGKAKYSVQDESKVTAAPKIFREDCQLNKNENVQAIYNKIRALLPYPCAWFEWNGSAIKVLKADKIVELHNETPGTLRSNQRKLYLVCTDGFIELLLIKPEGKKAMSGVEFINGSKLKI
ncbi:MAG: methionyl-tRNA formyltransferase [Saprospiraceae bacterium]|nr:methionyl-tRNA formyltransferase [Saprospiraceae bacterium]